MAAPSVAAWPFSALFLSHLRFVAAGRFLRAMHRSGKHGVMLTSDKDLTTKDERLRMGNLAAIVFLLAGRQTR